MAKGIYPNDTVFIHWSKRTMEFLNQKEQVVKVKFCEHRKKSTDIFEVCCFIAFAMQFCNEGDANIWPGVDATLYEAAQAEFHWSVGYTSLATYRKRVKDGTSSSQVLTHIRVGADAPKVQEDLAEDLFQVHNGHALLGIPKQQEDGVVRLWSVEFRDEDENYRKFKERALTVLHHASILPCIERKPQLVMATERMGNSPFQLSSMLKSAEKSLLIVGQNLYTLVKHEVRKASGGHEDKSQYRILIENWLLEKKDEKDKREVHILICDPKWKEAVLHYAMVFGSDFILHLCRAVLRYKQWQKEIGPNGFDVRVTRAVPLSLVLIDGDVAGSETAKMSITPPAFEPISTLRPRFMIHKKFNQSIFEHYSQRYLQLLDSQYTRPICEVSDQELSECKKLGTYLKSLYRRSETDSEWLCQKTTE